MKIITKIPKILFRNLKYYFAVTKYAFPDIIKISSLTQQQQTKNLTQLKTVKWILPSEIQKVQNIKKSQIKKFNNQNKVSIKNNEVKIEYRNFLKQKKFKLELKKNILLQTSQGVANQSSYVGALSQFLSSSYSFSLKTTQPKKIQPKIFYNYIPKIEHIIQLAHSRSYAKQLANTRANVGTPKFFENQCNELAKQNNLDIKIFKDKQLEENNFYLLNAVGRASINKPIFINLSYKGNPDNHQWIAFVGKGLCFDSGGLNIKVSNYMLDMHMDKHGAASVMAAIRAIARLKIKINLTVSLGFVENSINQNAYRPTDIIKSRKGLTVQIGNTDAEGRLTLADVMNWTQQVYKPSKLIELSTLTGAIVVALGDSSAGIFGNNKETINELQKAAISSQEGVWHLPILQQHREAVKSKFADLTNDSGKSNGGSSQAAAFLEAFVQKQTKWIHIDIAGTSMANNQATGYGSRLLVQFAKLEEQLNQKVKN